MCNFLVIFWKNFVQRKRHWLLTLCEILIPIAIFCFISYARSKIPTLAKQNITEPTIVPEQSAEFVLQKLNIHDTKILFSPKTEFTTRLIREVQLKLYLYNEGIHGFANEAELLSFYEKHGADDIITAAIIFSDVDNSIPKSLKYDIRMYEKHVTWNTERFFIPYSSYMAGIGSENYLEKAFIPIQMALDTSFIELVSGTRELAKNLTLTFQEFPYPPYIEDFGITNICMYILPLFTLFSFIFHWPSILKRVVEEKCSGIKELMIINGLDTWMLWMGWLLNALLLNLVSVFAIVCFLKFQIWTDSIPIQYTNGFVLIIFLTLYCAAAITVCFVYSTFFNKPTIAMITGILIWFISYLIFTGYADDIDVMSGTVKMILLVFPHFAMYFGYNAISMFELRKIDLNFSNLWESPTGSSGDISMGCVIIALLVDTVLLMFLTLYLDKVLPGPYGIGKSWDFPIKEMKNIIKPRKTEPTKQKLLNHGSDKIEKSNLPTKIEVDRLFKNYITDNGYVKEAVTNLSMEIYARQITVLLGPNGAGKTTTMSILTGMINATSGHVLIDGMDIKDDFHETRKLLSICPQHNLMFDDLTVMEHLVFFGKLKGWTKQNAEKAGVNLLNDSLKMNEKSNSFVGTLSGGMKRKLALGMALMGDPQILILDEPTAGVDIEGRREVWDLILSLKREKNKTILITTHFMEEADTLADKIAIMKNGKLLCYGTPVFLKKVYDVGYRITLTYNKPDDKDVLNEYNNKYEQMKNISKDEKDIKFEIKNNTLECYFPNNKKDRLSKFLSCVENKNNNFDVRVFNTTLEDVYLKAESYMSAGDTEPNSSENEHSEDKENNSNKRPAWNWLSCVQNKKALPQDSCEITVTGNEKRTTPSLYQQIYTLLKKKWLFFKKKYVLHITAVLILIVLTGLVIYLDNSGSQDNSKSGKKLPLDLDVYGETGVYFSVSGRNSSSMAKYYVDLVKAHLGIPIKVNNVIDGIIEKGTENIAYYQHRMVIAAEFLFEGTNLNVNVMFSNNALHGAPISLNMVMNTVAKAYLDQEYSISASNTPLHSTNSKITNLKKSEASSLLVWLLLFPLGPLFVVACAIINIHADDSTNIKKLISLCGVSSTLYWTVNVLFDVILYYVITVICCLPWIVYFLGGGEAGFVAVMLAVYVFSNIPLAYWFGKIKSTDGGYATFIILNMFLAPIMTATVLLTELSDDELYIHVGEKLRNVFSILPQFTLMYMSSKFSMKYTSNHNWRIKSNFEKQNTCNYNPNPCCGDLTESSESCRQHMSYFNDIPYVPYSIIIGGVFLFVMIVWDSYKCRYYLSKVFCCCLHKSLDVNAEPTKDDKVLKVQKLEKNYFHKNIISDLGFDVNRGQCFGILGVNGAGKSTTFRMLSEEEVPSSGTINKYLMDQQIYLGYCPQQDALLGDFSGTELLQMFSELRGLGSDVGDWLKKFGLSDYSEKPCRTYSGGNKRKLNTCIAMLGYPTLILLDEPTSGVCPSSRRKLWEVISKVKSEKLSALILTSHSMDECEILCDRISILKNGTMTKAKTIPELKKEHNGFIIKIKVTQSKGMSDESQSKDLIDKSQSKDLIDKSQSKDMSDESQSKDLTDKSQSKDLIDKSQSKDLIDKSQSKDKIDKSQSKDLIDKSQRKDLIMEFLRQTYVCEVDQAHDGLIHIKVNTTNWGDVFEKLEKLKNEFEEVEDYSVSEFSLEEAFLNIAKKEDDKECAVNLSDHQNN